MWNSRILSTSQGMPTWIIPASALQSSPESSSHWATALLSLPSPTGTPHRISCASDVRGWHFWSPAETSTPWWRTTPPPSGNETAISTPPAAKPDCVPTVPSSPIAGKFGRYILMLPSPSADWRHPSGALPTMTTGMTVCARPFWWTAVRICSCTAWENTRSQNWRSSWRRESPSPASRESVAPVTSPIRSTPHGVRCSVRTLHRSAGTSGHTPRRPASSTTSRTRSPERSSFSATATRCWCRIRRR